MFYCFDQNNSGGFFDTDDNVAQYVIIEADSADAANERAQEIGIYFDGVDEGIDCHCCGDRWSPAWECDATDTPRIYDKAPNEYSAILVNQGEVYCYVHYLNGIIEEHRHDENLHARLTV